MFARSLCDDENMQVLLVDDHEGFRRSARKLLELDGFAADGASALELARALKPELVLVDVALPDTSGFDLAERLAGVPSKVILVSSRGRRDFGERLRRSRALGFVAKDHLSGATLRALLDGHS